MTFSISGSRHTLRKVSCIDQHKMIRSTIRMLTVYDFMLGSGTIEHLIIGQNFVEVVSTVAVNAIELTSITDTDYEEPSNIWVIVGKATNGTSDLLAELL